MSAYLDTVRFNHTWIDARDIIKTDDTYRNAKINWESTIDSANKYIDDKHCITQGFIGSNHNGLTTTLGREGSDFTAAIIAFSLNASEVIISSASSKTSMSLAYCLF